ncbi:MAG: hypothetical protein JXA73_07210 [Acidobacteria bacterium]|nr:hypothetical protein [Acidobacteriota bacterium]
MLKQVGAKEVVVCQAALREGLIYDALTRPKPNAIVKTGLPDMRLQAVIDMASRCDYPPEHSHRVSFLVGQIFKQTAPLHGYGETEEKLLQYAGILHDFLISVCYCSASRDNNVTLE